MESLESVISAMGIDLRSLRKTEKTINQMSLEINLNFELSKAFEQKEQLEPLKQLQDREFFWGLANIGNSCYLNASLQALMAYSSVRDLLKNECANLQNPTTQEIWKLLVGIRRQSKNLPNQMCITKESENKQMFKTYRYVPRPDAFRKLIAQDHVEFKTNRQQDAAEYLQHVISRFSEELGQSEINFKDLFRVPTVNRLTCRGCKRFYLRNGETSMLKGEFSPATIEGILKGKNNIPIQDLIKQGLYNGDEVLSCQHCKKKGVFDSQMFLRAMPQNLLLTVRPFVVQGMTAKKLDFSLLFDPENIDMTDLWLKPDVKQNENEMQLENNQANDLGVNPEAMQNLINMGFPQSRCVQALKDTNNNIDAAIGVLFSKANDPNYGLAKAPVATLNHSMKNMNFDQVWMFVGEMGLSKEYVLKVCNFHSSYTAEQIVNYLLENPFDNGTIPENTSEPILEEQAVTQKNIGMKF